MARCIGAVLVCICEAGGYAAALQSLTVMGGVDGSIALFVLASIRLQFVVFFQVVKEVSCVALLCQNCTRLFEYDDPPDRSSSDVPDFSVYMSFDVVLLFQSTFRKL